jgi:hypothetical protein
MVGMTFMVVSVLFISLGKEEYSTTKNEFSGNADDKTYYLYLAVGFALLVALFLTLNVLALKYFMSRTKFTSL